MGLDLEKLTGCLMISDSNRPRMWDGLRADTAAYFVVTHEAHPPQSHSSCGEDQPCPKQLLRGLHGATSNNSGTNQRMLLLPWFHPMPRSEAQKLHPHLSGNLMRMRVHCQLSPLTKPSLVQLSGNNATGHISRFVRSELSRVVLVYAASMALDLTMFPSKHSLPGQICTK